MKTEIFVFFAVVFSVIASFIFGFMTGAEHPTKDAVIAKYQLWSKQDQRDFIIAATNNDYMLRRAIAEDWCATNKNTQLVCWNARNVK